ncbi:cell division/cell wall cluster transcriptional repressor MraZ [Erysipelatoclostridium sp. An173]|uniref:division/cell wall cluster transcriptional repressor MraZ n=1 Tax=Erysipelatoclostridium sp. An173 TaxID=1965571 RepID=UPI000B387DFC|nr:division/cell wall cluster transcriptional repressor MraZ [Erysipelatoclostridium sp. An173]OUP77786.1 cell division/cell wall cluster transcriptional repressor MraZ [Erysipelatoclostridium sp. An173]
MFMGQFKHNIDAKGRLIIPSKLREQCGDSVVITRGLDGCLALYTIDGWNEYYEKLHKLPTTKRQARDYVRIVTSMADELVFDKLGRVNISSFLRKEANLEKECMIIGAGDHVEIWNKDRWDSYYDSKKDSFDDICESLDDFDFDL